MPIREHGLYRKLPHPAGDAANGSCYLTGNAGECVDTGIIIHGEGTLTISVNAVRELAEVAGFSVNEDALAIETEIAHLRVENAAQRASILDLNEQLDAVSLMVARSAERTLKPSK